MFAQDIARTPHLRPGLLLSGWGGIVPTLAFGAVTVVSGVWKLVTGEQPLTWGSATVILYGALIINEIATWVGFYHLCRAGVWDGRVIFTLWIVGWFAAVTEVLTQAYILATLPLVIPILATFLSVFNHRRF